MRLLAPHRGWCSGERRSEALWLVVVAEAGRCQILKVTVVRVFGGGGGGGGERLYRVSMVSRLQSGLSPSDLQKAR